MISNFLSQNKELLILIIPLLIPLWKFIDSKSKQQNQINFERFHDSLMSGLANQGGEKVGLDQQVAILYELRNYPEYFPVVKRLLIYQIGRWEGLLGKEPHFNMLIQEANETLKYISKNPIQRLISRYK